MIEKGCDLSWEDIQAGAQIPPVVLLVTYEKVAMTPMATWDLFPGHNNPMYAAAQGQKAIYLNTIALQGFCDRVLTDWTGPATRITRRKMQMRDSVFAGDTLTGRGRVANVYRDERGNVVIDAQIDLSTQNGLVCTASTSAIIRSRLT
jgi:acyl dehydratase